MLIVNLIFLGLEALIVFGLLSSLPFVAKLVIIGLFALCWFCRKTIQDNVVSWMQMKTSEPATGSIWSKLESFMWTTESSEKTGADAWKYKRKPNESSLKLVKNLVAIAILAVFMGVPALVVWVYHLVGNLVVSIGAFFSTMGADLSFQNGFGFFALAVVWILVSLIAIALAVMCIIYRKTIRSSLNIVCFQVGRLSITGKLLVISTAIAVFAQRLVSWFYTEAGFGGAIGEIFTVGLVVLAIWIISKFKRKHHLAPTDPDDDDYDDPFDY